MSASNELEKKLYQEGYKHIIGIDEVGRGAWAGPVIVGAVSLPLRSELILDDSKKLTAKKRNILYNNIKQESIAHSVGIVSAKIIDRIGISQATIRAIQEALNKITIPIDYLLIDAIKLIGDIPSMSIIKGDSKIRCIAGASILAKVYRDLYMVNIAKKYPQYGFEKHVGYGVAKHKEALEKYGISPIHRKSFKPMKNMLQQTIDL